jgi:hypothetical protein
MIPSDTALQRDGALADAGVNEILEGFYVVSF